MLQSLEIVKISVVLGRGTEVSKTTVFIRTNSSSKHLNLSNPMLKQKKINIKLRYAPKIENSEREKGLEEQSHNKQETKENHPSLKTL